MTRFAIYLFVVMGAASLGAQTPAAYDQPYRPQFHFSPRENWTNDPNGLVYFDGEYHIFFQYNPFGDQWGHMSWGHAVSSDMLHWKELPVAIPEENGVMIFTGSAVVDERNTSGFCQGGKPCMVAIWTGHTPKTNTKPSLQTQNLAYSNDRGRTWTKYAGNPVLNLNKSDFRDPKVLWAGQSKQWVMVVALPNEHKVVFYGSPDFKAWQKLSEFGPEGAAVGQWECPELFETPIEGKKETRWVLKIGINPGSLQGGSGEQYFVGKFDGQRFQNENPPSTTLWTDYGKDCYCALTFNHLPKTQKPTAIGWMSNWEYAGKTPTAPWRGQMTVPRQLSLRQTSAGLRLMQQPIAGLQSLRGLATPVHESLTTAGRQFEFTSAVPVGKAEEVGWDVFAKDGTYVRVGYDRLKQVVFVDRTHGGLFPARTEAPLELADGKLHLDLLVDRSSLEVFANGGQVTLTNIVFAPAGADGIRFYSKGGDGGKGTGTLWNLKSTWR